MSEIESMDLSESGPLYEACSNCGVDLEVTSLDPLSDVTCMECGAVTQVRTRLKNYVIEGVLGSGGMGSVYKAHDLNLNRHVALKVIHKEFSGDAEHLKKFEEEARITALVNHPNVVKVFSFGSDHGVLFIAMELAEMGNLDELMNLQGRIAETQALEVGIQIANGLKAAYERGLIHRDVKPGNILFTDAHTSKIVDFGLAQLVEQQAEARGEVWGTPYYVAPEKLNHQPEDFRSDIYSLGGTLFHAIAGRPPHAAETASLVALKHIKSKTVNLRAFAPDVSNATAFVINRMLQMKPDERYQSYTELIEHLIYARNKLLEHGDGGHAIKSHLAVERDGTQWVTTWIAILLLAVLLAAGAGYYKYHGKIFKQDDASTEELARKAASAEANVNKLYEDGRKLILKGDNAGAAKALGELAARVNIPQPLGRWILLHQGLSELMEGKLNEARAIFEKLQEKGMYSLDPADKALANFFVETGRVIGDGNPVSQRFIKYYNPADCEAMALLLFGIADWQMSQIDSAGPLLHAFIDSDPKPPFAWISDYKPVAKRFAADFDAYKLVADAIAAADTVEKKNVALTALRALEATPLMPGKLPDKLRGMESDLAREIAGIKAAEDQQRADQLAQELQQQSKLLDAATTKFNGFADGWQFEEGVVAIQSVQLTVAQVENERAALLQKAHWLVDFKTTLSADINAIGYPLPVAKRNGIILSGKVGAANRTRIEIQTPYGSVVVLWSELAPASILAMADYFSQKNTLPGSVADRQWLAGIYAVQAGLPREGRAHLSDAAEKSAAYKAILQQVLSGESCSPQR